MEKRKVGWFCVVTGVFLFTTVTAIGAIVKHEPNFYRQAQIPASQARTELDKAFLSNFVQMMANRKNERWSCKVTEAQINSFFEESFGQLGEAENLRKIGITAPSVVLEKDKLRLAFRYGSGWFSTVVSYELKVWLVPKEANVVAIEVLSSRAGALPITSHSVIQQLADFLGKQNFKVTLYRHERNSVMVVDLQNDQPHPSSLLTTLHVDTDGFLIGGRTLEFAVAPAVVMDAPKN